MKTFKKITQLFILLLLANFSYSQIGIKATNSPPHPSAMLDVESTTKGMLVPRMTSSQRTLISNLTPGLLVYDTDVKSFFFYDGTVWKDLSAGGGGGNYWLSNGPDIYNANGTLGRVGIGTNTPGATLSVLRGNAEGGTAAFSGTQNTSNFNFGFDENTYIRGGKNGASVIINDIPGGYVGIGKIPEFKLDVAGHLAVDGIYIPNGGPAQGKVLSSGNLGFGSWAYNNRYTVLSPSGANILNTNVTNQYIKISDLGQFNKLDANTAIELNFFSNFHVGTIQNASAVTFELRIDNIYLDTSQGKLTIFALGTPINAGITLKNTNNLAVGNHSVSLWAKVGGGLNNTSNGTATNVYFDYGNFYSTSLIVKEVL